MRAALVVLFLLTCSALNITNPNVTKANNTMSDSAEIERITTIVGSVIGGVVGCIIVGFCFVRYCCK